MQKGITIIDASAVEEYFAYRAERVSKSTLKNDYISAKTVFDYAVSHGYMTDNPCLKIDRPKPGKHSIRVFTETEIVKMLSTCDKEKFIGLRNYSLINILLGTGIRVSELCSIKIDDIDWENNWIIIHGKGDKDRIVPMTNSLRKILMRYLKARKAYINKNFLPILPYIMISKTGKQLYKDEIGNIFVDIKRKIGATGARFSPHTFRHTFATLYLKNGGNVFSLQKILGHNSLNTTRIYVNLSQSDIRTQMQKFSPLDNESWKFI